MTPCPTRSCCSAISDSARCSTTSSPRCLARSVRAHGLPLLTRAGFEPLGKASNVISLICGHSFCQQCVQHWAQRAAATTGEIACPECRGDARKTGITKIYMLEEVRCISSCPADAAGRPRARPARSRRPHVGAGDDFGRDARGRDRVTTARRGRGAPAAAADTLALRGPRHDRMTLYKPHP